MNTNSKRNKIFRILAAAFFAIWVVIYHVISFVYDIIIYELSFGLYGVYHIFAVVGIILLIVGLFTDKAILSSIGAGLNALAPVFETIQYYILSNHILFDAYLLLQIAFWLLIVFVILSKGKAPLILGCIAALVRIYIEYIYASFPIYSLYGLAKMSLIVGALMIGIAFSSLPSKISINLSSLGIKQSSNDEPKTADTQNNIDKLLKLKELLDMGAITQEEFDEKKKQLLGL